MPVLKIKATKTMRNVWDEMIKTAKRQKKIEAAPMKERFLNKKDLQGLAKQRMYFLEHLKRRKMVMDFFQAYEEYLGDAGFSKISKGQFKFNKKVENN